MSARAGLLTVAAAISIGAGRPSAAQDQAATGARGQAVKLIMGQIEEVSLDPLTTTREVFARAPALRLAAQGLVQEVADRAPVAALGDGAVAVDVKVSGDLLRERLEKVRRSAGLPREWAELSFDALATGGRLFTARGRSAPGASGGPAAPVSAPAEALPPKWRQVSAEGRAHAAKVARAKALADGVQQVVDDAVRLKLAGAAALRPVCDARWLATVEEDLRRGGARDARGPVYLEDGTCEVEVEVPAVAIFDALDARGGVPGLPPRVRAELRRGLAEVVRRGLGRGVPPAPIARPPTWPRVLTAEGRGRPPAGTSGPTGMAEAARAARVEAIAKLGAQVRRLPVDERRTVADVLEIQPDADGRVTMLLQDVHEVESKEIGGGWWSVKVELDLDRLSAALAGR